VSPAKHNSAFVGFGQSRILRHDDIPLGELAVEASLAAIADAGLGVSQIDGVACVPDQPFAMKGQTAEGTQYVTSEYMIKALGIDAKWNTNVSGMLGGSAVETIRAIEAGLCSYALIFRALHSPSGSYGHTQEEEASGHAQFVKPYGLFSPASLSALAWSRYQDRYKSGSREQMATYVVQERRNGLLYEGSYWHQYDPTELTVEDYLSARVVSTPMSMYDCDIPVQGVGAFIVTTADRARDLPHPPAYVRGIGTTSFLKMGSLDGQMEHARNSLTVGTLDNQIAHARSIGESLWADSGLRPSDVKVADLYDGFSMLTMCWIEGLGFCGEGEVFDFIQEGRIAIGGELPVNPSGGNLGCGRLHGVNQLMDGILQVMGRSGPRQVADADIALITIGPAGAFSPGILLGREQP
jgi:acetyl-CoA acetyltransferase